MAKTHRILFILFGIILPLSGLHAQDHNFRFERLSLESGLSQTTVLSIYQCSKGFMWFGTRHGVNKFDGYDFTVYSYDPNNPHSISNNWISVIFEDSDTNIWIGTRDGLNKLNREAGKGVDFENEQFIRYNHESGNLSNSRIHTIYEDATGRLWVGTHKGLNYIDKEKTELIPYPLQQTQLANFSERAITAIIEDEDGELWVGAFNGELNRISHNRKEITSYLSGNKKGKPLAHQSISSNSINALFQDNAGNIWIATNNGLDRFNKRTGEFHHYGKDDESKSILHNHVSALTEDHTGALWIGTWGGLSRLDKNSGNVTNFKHDPADPSSLSTNHVKSLFTDKTGAIWIGTVLGGINRYDPHKNRFKKFSAEPFSENGLSSRLVYSFFETKKGDIWIGTGNGINIFDSAQKRFLKMSEYNRDLAKIRGNIFSICRARNDEVWVGTNGNGLYLVRENGNGLKRFQCKPGNPNSLGSNSVWSILEDSSGNSWIGTNGGGLNKYDRKDDSFTRYLHDRNNKGSLSHNWVRTIFEDSEGTLWLGTEDGGLNKFDRNSGQFKHYKTVTGDITSLSHNSVTSIYEDPNGFLWVATYGGGINRFDKTQESFARFTESDGLANNVVYGIVPDEQDRIWLSTNKGLSCFDPETETFKNYDVDDGLQSNEFNSCAYFKNRSGELFFGGVSGFNVFHPDSIVAKLQAPPVLVTSVKIFDQPLTLDATAQQQLELSHNDDFIAFEFVALDYTNSHRNQYAYKLDGFDPIGFIAAADVTPVLLTSNRENILFGSKQLIVMVFGMKPAPRFNY